MTSMQKYMMLGCILMNLLAGNLYLYIIGMKEHYGAPGTPNYNLMIGASIASILCYLFLFIRIHPVTRNVFLLWLLSLGACVAIAMLGNTIAGLLYFGIKSVSDFFVSIITGMVTGFIGAFLFFQFIIPVSLTNLIWLVLFVKNAP